MAKDKIKKTNATRILDKNKTLYSMYEYPIQDKAMSGLEVAEYLQKDPHIIFKTLVLIGDKTGLVVAIIPASNELDLKKLAKASNNKKVEMIASKDLKPNTGYVHGGCSPIGMKKLYPSYIDESAILFDKIIVSAGEIGKQIELSPDDLKSVINAEFSNLVAEH